MFKKKHSNSFNLLDITDLTATANIRSKKRRGKRQQALAECEQREPGQ